MEKQNKNEDTVKAEDINQNKPMKEKKHSNAKAGLIVVGGFVVMCMAFMIITGSWNPFKNQSADKKAIEIVNKSNMKETEIARNMFKELDCTPNEYNGLESEVYESGGCLKRIKNSSSAYQDYYDVNFEIFYMKNEDYANEKFAEMKSQLAKPTGYNKTHEFKNGKVHIYVQNGWIYYVIQDGSVVYCPFAGLIENIDMHQRFFNDFGIDYTIPKDTILKNK